MIPLSYAQRRLWFLDQVEGPSARYNLPFVVEARGPLDVTALRAAVHDVVVRHQSLRTLLVADEHGVPWQHVVPVDDLVLDIPLVDLTGQDAGRTEDSVVAEWSARHFALADEIPIRAGVLRRDESAWVLVLVVHHCAADGESMGPLAADLSAAYRARSAGAAPVWGDLAVQYGDFAMWQQELLEEVAARQLDFWRDVVAGAPGVVSVPGDRVRGAVVSGRGARVEFELDAVLTGALGDLARAHGMSRAMVAQAVLVVLLSRLGGGKDVVLGSTVAGRVEPELADLVGFFVNTWVLRVDLGDDPSLAEVLRRVRAHALAAYDHQDLPFEQLVETLNPERSVAAHPLFQVMLTWQTAESVPLDMAGAPAVLRVVPTDTAKFDLEFNFAPHGDGLRCTLEYSTDLYDRATVAGLADRFVRVAEQFAAGLTTRAGAVSVLLPRERAELDRFNDTARPHDPAAPVTVPEVFGRQVRLTPDAVAVADAGLTLTYRELDELSARVAAGLRAAGVGPESLVAVAMPRSADLVAALLGVLRCGAGYLPVDPRFPSERLRFAVADAGVVLALTEPGALAELPDLGVPHVLFDDVRTTPAGAEPAVHPDSTAYVLHTSGSTGVPKGVVIAHRNIVTCLPDLAAVSGIETGTRVFAGASIGFDVSVFELLATLSAGGRVELVRDVLELGERDDWLSGGPVVLSGVPSVLNLLLSGVDAPDAPVTGVVFAGEGLTWAVADAVRRVFPAARVVNAYGQSETYYASLGVVERTGGVGLAPVGAPIGGVRIHVLDEALAPVPPGVTGEIYVGGASVGRGYRDRPGLTAGRFVADPAGSGGRMFRTGDLGRVADGALVFAGRADDQVKVRGIRIEPAEVESVTGGHPGVAAVAARVWDGRLVAYVVPVEVGGIGTVADLVDVDVDLTAGLSAGELRAFVAARLPEYMVPSVFVVVDELPLTPSGKVDRAALPEPQAPVGAYRAPDGHTEQVLAAVYAEVLGVDVVGVDDDFFAVGGDSIRSIQVVSRARARGVGISPREVFRQRTVAALAELVEGRAGDTPVLAELPGGGTGWAPLLPVARYLLELGGGRNRFAMSVVVDLPEGVDEAGLVATLDAVTDRHDVLRSRLVVSGAEPGLEVAPQGSVNVRALVHRVPWGGRWDARLAAALLDEASDGLDPESGIVARYVWFDAGPAAGRLLIVLHHLVVDGVSWRVLLPDLAAAWARVRTGAQPGLAVSGTSARRWAHALAEEAVRPGRVAELAFWQSVVDGPDPLLGSRPLDPVLDVAGTVEHHWVTVAAPVTEALLTELPARFHGGVNDGLVAALALAVVRWRRDRGAGVPSVLLKMEGHGREDAVVPGADLSQTVGWFTAMYPVRLDLTGIGVDDALAGGAQAGAAVKAVKEQLRAVPDRGIGFGLLRYLNPETARVLEGAGIGQIAFNYLGRHAAADMPENLRGLGWTQAGDTIELVPVPDPDMPAMAVLEINAMAIETAEGLSLRARVSHPRGVLDAAAATELIDLWCSALRGLSEHLADPAAGGRTPSDLPLVSLRQQEIEEWESRYPGLADVWPLTGLQSGLLYHALLAGTGADAYHVQFVFHLSGQVDPERMRRAGQALLDRHAPLRGAFVASSAGDPVQVLPARAGLPWRHLDLTGQPASVLDEHLERDRRTPFDVTRPPLLRLTLATLGAGRAELVLTAHHVLFDGWSVPLLMSDLLRLYASGGDAAALPRVREYREFLGWLAGQDQDAAVRAWTRELAGVNEPTLLARGVAGSAEAGDVGQVDVALPGDLARTLAGCATRLGITLNTLVQAAWGVLLGKLTGRDDVVFGATVSGRPADVPGVDTMVGLFINTVPVRVAGGPGERFADVAADLQRRQAELLDHHHCGLAGIQRAVGLPELFDTVVVFESFPVDRAELAEANTASGITITGLSPVSGSHYPFALVADADPVLRLALQFRHDVVGAAEAEATAARFGRLLSQVAAEPELAVGDVDLLTPGERDLVVRTWNDTDHPVLATTLPALFSAQVASTPEAPALTFEDRTLTYAELDAEVDALAHTLAGLGVRPETVVGVLLPRSAELLVALLAVHRAGAAYLPIDAGHPAARIEHVLREARPLVTLTGREEPPVEVPGRLVVGGPLPRRRAEPVPPAPGNAAYLLYTSGSTGSPKGVLVEHAAIVNRLLWMRDEYGVGPGDRVLQKTPAGFDVSVWELFLPLLCGAELVVARPGGHRDPAYLAETVRRAGVTLVHFVPTMLRAFLAEPAAALCTSLRGVICSGEPLPDTLRDECRKVLTATLHNLYGPTEAAVDVTAGAVAQEGTVTIGTPVWNTRVYVLDQRLRPVPPGTAGELYLAGVQLARGYLGRPGLTADRFVADPFRGRGSRLYRTGDVVRWDDRGELVHLGRADGQIKVRGQRVELGEIESVLAGHPGVAQAVVLPHETAAGERTLAAYLVPSAATAGPVAALTRLRADGLEPDAELHELPGGMAVWAHNRSGVDFLHREIFDRAEYANAVATLPEDACVLDVGAHVGMFSLLLGDQRPGCRVVAVEPVPELAAMLRANLVLNGVTATVLDCGLGSTPGAAVFTYYPDMSMMSGRYADEDADREVLARVVRNQTGGEETGLDELLTDRLRSVRVEVPVRTLSQVIREHGLTSVDLLKLDVEKAELDVLHGVEPEHWPIIGQVVAEVHDLDGRLATVVKLLCDNGFDVAVEETDALEGTGMHSVHATRPGPVPTRVPIAARVRPRWGSERALAADVRTHAARLLPEHMVPAGLVFLSEIPATANGKLDRAALPQPRFGGGEAGFRAPRTPREALLCGLFAELLGAERVGADDDFFALGGHSVLVTKLVNRLRAELGADVPIRTVFDAPTAALLAERITEGARSRPPLERAAVRPERVPLSAAQRRVWFIDRFHGPSAAYNLPFALRLTGPLDAAALREALSDVVGRHESLRTLVHTDDDGVPHQVVLPPSVAVAELTVVDAGDERAVLAEAAAHVFDLAADLPVRATLVRRGEREHVLLLLLHHIAGDGESMPPLVRDLATAYGARLRGMAPCWAEPPVQYADHTLWQQELLGSEEDPASLAAAQIGHWRQELADPPPPLSLPGRARSAVPSGRGDTVEFGLDATLMTDVRAFAARHGATAPMVVQAALAVLLRRFCGDDVLIGSPIANRSDAALADSVGFFLNTWVLRVRFAGDPAFTDVVAQVRARSLDAYDNQDVPFDRLVELLNPDRAPGRHPFFQVMFAWQAVSADAFSLPGLRVGLEAVHTRTAKFDLCFNLTDLGSEVLCHLEYATDVVDRDLVEDIASSLRTVLTTLVTDPGTPIGELVRAPGRVAAVNGELVALDAVEAVLAGLPGVADAAVAAGGDGGFVGYVVPRHTGDGLELVDRLSTARLRQAAAEQLPAHAVPSSFVVVGSLPRLADGTADPAALPKPVTGRAPYRAPEGDVEVVLAEVVAEVLGLDRVGVDDDYFLIGGDSIRSIQVVSRARARGIVVTPRQVFERRTVAGLALAAAEARGGPALAELPGGGTGLVPLPSMARFVVERGGGLDRFAMVSVLRVPPGLDETVLTAALAALVNRHDALRARLTGEGLLIGPAGSVDASALLTTVPGDDLQAAADTAVAGLRPAEGAVLRCVSVPSANRLVVAVHHLVVDAVSWQVLLPDLAAACARVLEGRAPALPAVGTSLRRWMHGLLESAQDRVAEMDHWRSVLAGGDVLLGTRDLDPALDVRSTVRGFTVEVPAETTRTLLAAVPAALHCGVEDALLAGLAVAVAAVRAEPAGSVLVRVEGHGREEDLVPGADLSRTVGWFTSTFPVRVDVSATALPDVAAGGAAAGEVVARVRRAFTELPGRGAGFGVLRWLNEETGAELAGAPLGQVGFNYLGRHAESGFPEEQRAAGFAQDLDAAASVEVGFDADMPALAVLDVNAFVTDAADGSRLTARFDFASAVVPAELAQRVAEAWLTALSGIARHAADQAHGLSAANLSLVRLSGREVDAISARHPGATDVWPVTPLQSGLLFESMVTSGVDVYQMQLVAHVEGEIDPPRLHAAAQALLDRHDNLRVAFARAVSGEQLQVVCGAVRLPWHEFDLRGLPDADDRLAAFLAEDARDRLDPAVPPLLRVTLVRLADDAARLVLTVHHALLDGWSVPVLVRDLLALHRGDALAPAPPYRDYLAWLAARDRQAGVAAWAEALDGVDEPTLLAAGRRTGAVARAEALEEPTPLTDAAAGRDPAGARELEVPLSADVAAALAARAAQLGVTLNTVVQTAWGLVLSALTGRDDVVFGTTVSGRDAAVPGVDEMVGLFINTVPVRVRHTPWDTLAGVLAAVQRQQAALLDHHHTGLPDVQRALGLPALFDTTTVFESFPVGGAPERAPDEVVITTITADNGTHYGMGVSASADPLLRLVLRYQRDLFGDGYAEAVLARLGTVLRLVATAPDTPVGAIGLVDPVDHAAVLARTDGSKRAPVEETVPVLFGKQAAATPEAEAVVFGDRVLTYRELDERSAALARDLVRRGVRPESVVAAGLRRSPELVVALLAVMRAGAAYLPIDHALPPDRIRYMTEDADAVLVLVDKATAAGLAFLPAPALRVDAAGRDGGAEVVEPAVHVDNTAYVIYTSGSTGRPKGVAVPHRGIAALAAGHVERMRVTGDSRMLQFASASFDVSLCELFTALLSGAAIVLADREALTAGERLARTIDAHRVTHAMIPPAVLATLPADALSTVESLVVGGEVTPPELVARWAPGRRVTNVYGPTETTACATMSLPLTPGAGDLPIGLAVPGTRLHVLDHALRPVPAGVAGELYVAGSGVARGYVGRPGLTSERFLPSPFGMPGERMYRTGDVVSLGEDGQLVFLGRLDQQVKLRGFRVELAEIEAVLLAHEDVRRAAVVVDTSAGDRRLVAYVVPSGTPAPGLAAGLREHLRGRLPDYMVVSAVVLLKAIPLTTSSKVDRRRLPAPDYTAQSAGRPPRTVREEILAGLFAEVLGVDRVGVDDDFFALGGHSLLATRLVDRISAVLGVDVPIKDVFAATTAADLAAVLEPGAALAAGTPLDPFGPVLVIKHTGDREPLWWVHPGGGICWPYLGLAGSLPADRPAYGIQAKGFDGMTPLPASIEEMVADYADEVLAVQPQGPFHLAGLSVGGTLAHALACELRRRGHEVGLLAVLDSAPARYLTGESAPTPHEVREWFAEHLTTAGANTGTESFVDNAVTVIGNHVRLMPAFTSPVYDGDIVFFNAVPNTHGSYGPLWEPYTTGEIRERDIASAHGEMYRPRPAAEICQVLCEELGP
ncbi:non-ribosomal peptide synthetase [Lentzea flaviverrucosa]|uniref:Methyltransferase, FkbM family/non-ribosomal peptide synthase domain TIGR01720/amino acid adenylation domain-containing protein n=1 Tax=Lentzea flaviverrucosa TaxID=200379 RepID=A0A1H9SGB6_9PSEU|nr:non-ribosomal peptide synthetase [Lentzea flaviverrucosa]RDI25336.1 FkbM family methyltransferase/non-ribosomal peptide synthase protein (TIGR01720 family)/amino acid adenylation domain-containing protein [Lentzea flaviverrucosa]SER83259.1 methyltransferase, FkbM family/non-ribosomal peptide synthase domain TIGR01720/amino acid adenylation domain-containing protein [Lentzea flaviverrucosa]